MPFNRKAAIDYARRFWDRPCDDGIFWLTNAPVNVEHARKDLGTPASEGWEARFIPDGMGAEKAVFQRPFRGFTQHKLIHQWDGLADCAHFLSRCIQAGGTRINEISVPKIIRSLMARSDTKTLAEQVPQHVGQRIVDAGLLQSGDMIGYFNVNPDGDYGGARQYSHSTMFVGKLNAADVGRITCHTKSRFAGLSPFPDEWFLESGSYLYTFIHFSADDTAADTATATALQGWWRHTTSAGTDFYHISKDGRAHRALTAPRSAHDPVVGSVASSYWFQQSTGIAFCWRQTGALEIWRPSGTANEYLTTVNGIPGGKANKL